MTLGDELKANRKKQYLPQARLAEQLGVPRSTVWRWETGKNKPNHDFYMKLREMGLLRNDYEL